MGDKHGPNRLDRYQEIHETVMERLRKEGFILSDDLEFAVLGNGVIELKGLVECLGGIRTHMRTAEATAPITTRNTTSIGTTCSLVTAPAPSPFTGRRAGRRSARSSASCGTGTTPTSTG